MLLLVKSEALETLANHCGSHEFVPGSGKNDKNFQQGKANL